MKKCPKCGAVWYTDLPKCAFCGIEGEEQALPDSVGQVMDRGKSAPPSEAAQPAAVPDTKTPGPPVPPPDTKAPAPFVPPKPQPPPAPLLPSATVPLAFGLLGLAASAVVPAISFAAWNRIGAVLLTLAASVLTPFAPLAWWTGLRYEERCEALGFRPAPAGRAGRQLGMAVTLLLALEGSVVLFLDALRRLGAP